MSELLEHSPFDPASERRVVIIADWLPPDFGAVGQYMQMRARGLAERGHDVTLVGLSSTASSVKHEAMAAGTLTELRLLAKPVPRFAGGQAAVDGQDRRQAVARRVSQPARG